MSAYYNEIDPFAAQWIRELIKEDLIAPGVVDERSIEDVTPSDIKGFTQCHFFAGIGVWSYALRQAGWPDDRPVWTGSCPCQPFSSAGKRKGASDERHLWPAWEWLIRQCSPRVVFGEQVAKRAGLEWLDIVSTDMESRGYAIGAAAIPACGVGAPHLRERLFWVADSGGKGPQIVGEQSSRGELTTVERSREAIGVEHSAGDGRESWRSEPGRRGIASGRGVGRVGQSGGFKRSIPGKQWEEVPEAGRSGPVNGFWADAEWVYCSDGKYRPVESSPLDVADGIADQLGFVRHEGRRITHPLIQRKKTVGRIHRLRGSGNAIVASLAIEFIKAFKGE